MKQIIFLVLLLVLGFVLHLFLPWWILPLLAGILAFVMKMKPLQGFGLAFFVGALLWGGVAAYLNMQNEGILATKIGQLFGGLGPNLLVLVTALFGALFASLGSCSGSFGWQYAFGQEK